MKRRIGFALGTLVAAVGALVLLPWDGTPDRKSEPALPASSAAAGALVQAANEPTPPAPSQDASRADPRTAFPSLPADAEALRDLLPQLLPRAAQGDAAAACWAAAELRTCRWAAVHEAPASRCEGIEPHAIRAAIPLALQAAKGGDGQSAVDFLGLHPFTAADLIAEPGLIELYRREGVELLESELHRGNVGLALLLALRTGHDPLLLDPLLPDALRNPRILQAIQQRMHSSLADRMPPSIEFEATTVSFATEAFAGLSDSERTQFEDYWRTHMAPHEALRWPDVEDRSRAATHHAGQKPSPRDRCARLQ